MEPPSFSINGPQIVRAACGSDVSLVLSLPSGSPPFQYEWSRAGAKLDDRFKPGDDAGGVRLIISAARTDDSGTYTLQASNAAGKDTTRVRLEVFPDEKPTGDDPPSFLRRLQDLTVKVGTRTRFLVEIVSSTECRVTWYRNERRLLEAERIALVRDGNFWCADISAVSVDDAGRWTCTAENLGGRASCSAHLNVLVPKAYKRPEFVEELRALLTEQGTVSLECKVVGVPTPVLRWFKDSREIKAGDVFALTANAEDPTSLGTYTCEAVNCMGRAYSSSKVHVIGRASREGSSRPSSGGSTLEPPPIFTKELEDQFVRICEPLSLSCNIVVPPWPRSVVWYNKEGKIEPSDKYRVLEDGVGGYLLEVPSSEWPDEGEWKCVASSSGGRVGITTCYVSMDVPKNYRKPRFMENLQAVLTEEGLVSFECKVVGFPTPVLSWFKDGQELKPGDVYQLTGTNSLGSYCCIARNCMGQASSSAELTVEDIQNQLNEEEKLQLFSKNQAPKFLQGLKSVEAKIDEPFRFTIKVAIPPEPTVLWYRDDQPMDESSRCHHGKEERGVFFLDIQSLEFMDQAEWKCVATNDFGHSVTSCFLKLIIPRHYKKPRFLENLQAILSDEGAVNLECKVIGVPQPVLKWYKDGEELKPGDIHRIISGQDGTCCLGTYTCEAQNCMGIAASSASLLGFEDSINIKSKKKADNQPLQRNLSLSTIHEERTSQMYDTPVGDITLDDKGEISFSFDGKEVSVSLYETPDLTEEEALQIVEMYADQLSENITEHNVVELPPLRFVKETSTSGNLLMEAIIIDVSPEYFTSPEEDLRTEADIEDISIADENGPSQLSLDQEADGEDYLEKTIALLSDERCDFPKKTERKKSDSQKSLDDYFSLSRDQSLSEEKKDEDYQVLSESDIQSFASARSSGKVKSKSSKPSNEDGQESSDITKTVVLREVLQKGEHEQAVEKKVCRGRSLSSRRSSSSSEKSNSKKDEQYVENKPTFENNISENTIQTVNSISSSLSKILNEIQIIERDIILKSELMSTAATASRSLEIINSLIIPLSEIHSIMDTIKETVTESLDVTTSLFHRLPQSLNELNKSLTVIEKCIDIEYDNKTLVKKCCTNIIDKCSNDFNSVIKELSLMTQNDCPFLEAHCTVNIQTSNNEILNTINRSEIAIRESRYFSNKNETTSKSITAETEHLQKTQKAVFELKNPLKSLLYIIDEIDMLGIEVMDSNTKSQIILNDMSTPIQDLQNALEQIECLSVIEVQSNLYKHNTEIIEAVMDSVLKLRTSFEQLSAGETIIENVEVLKEILTEIKQNINDISSHLNNIETKIGPFDVLHSENKLEILQKMAQILINLENTLATLDTNSNLKIHMTNFHKNLTKVLEDVIESNDVNKYLKFFEICDTVSRINTLLKNMDSNDMLSYVSINKNLKIIQTNIANICFSQELNYSISSNISDLIFTICEKIQHADTSTFSMTSENIEELSIKPFKERKLNVAMEQIEKAISTISNVISLETTTDFVVKNALDKIMPSLAEINCYIASTNVSVTEMEENISELGICSLTQSVAQPLCELVYGITILNEIIIEKVESHHDSLSLKLELPLPLLELRNALEILQQDVISQHGENVNDPDISSSIAKAVQSTQSCILMIQEHDCLEIGEDLSTLEDISAIKTSAEISSDRLISPVILEIKTSVDSHTSQFSLVETLRNLNDHISKLKDDKFIDSLNKLFDHYHYSSIIPVLQDLDKIKHDITDILLSLSVLKSENFLHFVNLSQLQSIIEPLLEIQDSLFTIDFQNQSLENDRQKEHFIIVSETLTKFEEYLNVTLELLTNAFKTTTMTLDVSTEVSTLQNLCEELEFTLNNYNIFIGDSSPDLNKLRKAVRNVIDSLKFPGQINFAKVKHTTTNLYDTVIMMQNEVLRFVVPNPEVFAQEVEILKSLTNIENTIIQLEKLEFLGLGEQLKLQHTVDDIDIEPIRQIEKNIEKSLTLTETLCHDLPENDLLAWEDLKMMFRNEITLLNCLINQKPTPKKVIKILQIYHNMIQKIEEMKSYFNSSSISKEHRKCLVDLEKCLRNIQVLILGILDRQSLVIFDVPISNIIRNEIILNDVIESNKLIDLHPFAMLLLTMIKSMRPWLNTVQDDVITELKSSDVGVNRDDDVIEMFNLLSKFVSEQKSHCVKYKQLFETIFKITQGHADCIVAQGSGKKVIILKCMSECLNVLNEQISEDKIEQTMNMEFMLSNYDLKNILIEISQCIESFSKKFIFDISENTSNTECGQIINSVEPCDTTVEILNVSTKNLLECIQNRSRFFDNDTITSAKELNNRIHAVQKSINNFTSSTTDNHNVMKINKALEDIKQILGSALSDIIGGEDKQLKEKTDSLLQHIDKYIEIIEIVEEVSAVIKIDDLKKSTEMVRELRESITVSEPSDLNISGSELEIGTEQIQLAQNLQKALTSLQIQSIEREQELALPITQDMRHQIIEVVSDLQNDLVALTSSSIAFGNLDLSVLENAIESHTKDRLVQNQTPSKNKVDIQEIQEILNGIGEHQIICQEVPEIGESLIIASNNGGIEDIAVEPVTVNRENTDPNKNENTNYQILSPTDFQALDENRVNDMLILESDKQIFNENKQDEKIKTITAQNDFSLKEALIYHIDKYLCEDLISDIKKMLPPQYVGHIEQSLQMALEVRDTIVLEQDSPPPKEIEIFRKHAERLLNLREFLLIIHENMLSENVQDVIALCGNESFETIKNTTNNVIDAIEKYINLQETDPENIIITNNKDSIEIICKETLHNSIIAESSFDIHNETVTVSNDEKMSQVENNVRKLEQEENQTINLLLRDVTIQSIETGQNVPNEVNEEKDHEKEFMLKEVMTVKSDEELHPAITVEKLGLTEELIVNEDSCLLTVINQQLTVKSISAAKNISDTINQVEMLDDANNDAKLDITSIQPNISINVSSVNRTSCSKEVDDVVNSEKLADSTTNERSSVFKDINTNEEKSFAIRELETLLFEVSEILDLSLNSHFVQSSEELQDMLEEVQTVIMKLKCTCDGSTNDSLNENLIDLECNVRSVQLQVNEKSPPALLKEACVNLQMIVSTMSNIQHNEEILISQTAKDATFGCIADAEQVIELLENVAYSKVDTNLDNIISNLNNVKDTMKSLKSSFVEGAESLIDKGNDLLQHLNLVEDKVFSIEKVLEVSVNIDSIFRDNIIAAVHSIYGSVSNMRGAICSIQKQYMHQKYGKPCDNFLKSIKNVNILLKLDNNIDWKQYAKTLRRVLNHFEDIKFYINFDKTARLPSDAAFTKIILSELSTTLSKVVLENISHLDKTVGEQVNDSLKYINEILCAMENQSTLEVKDKIPIFMNLSKKMFALTNDIKNLLQTNISVGELTYIDYNDLVHKEGNEVNIIPIGIEISEAVATEKQEVENKNTLIIQLIEGKSENDFSKEQNFASDQQKPNSNETLEKVKCEKEKEMTVDSKKSVQNIISKKNQNEDENIIKDEILHQPENKYLDLDINERHSADKTIIETSLITNNCDNKNQPDTEINKKVTDPNLSIEGRERDFTSNLIPTDGETFMISDTEEAQFAEYNIEQSCISDKTENNTILEEISQKQITQNLIETNSEESETDVIIRHASDISTTSEKNNDTIQINNLYSEENNNKIKNNDNDENLHKNLNKNDTLNIDIEENNGINNLTTELTTNLDMKVVLMDKNDEFILRKKQQVDIVIKSECANNLSEQDISDQQKDKKINEALHDSETSLLVNSETRVDPETLDDITLLNTNVKDIQDQENIFNCRKEIMDDHNKVEDMSNQNNQESFEIKKNITVESTSTPQQETCFKTMEDVVSPTDNVHILYEKTSQDDIGTTKEIEEECYENTHSSDEVLPLQIEFDQRGTEKESVSVENTFKEDLEQEDVKKDKRQTTIPSKFVKQENITAEVINLQKSTTQQLTYTELDKLSQTVAQIQEKTYESVEENPISEKSSIRSITSVDGELSCKLDVAGDKNCHIKEEIKSSEIITDDFKSQELLGTLNQENDSITVIKLEKESIQPLEIVKIQSTRDHNQHIKYDINEEKSEKEKYQYDTQHNGNDIKEQKIQTYLQPSSKDVKVHGVFDITADENKAHSIEIEENTASIEIKNTVNNDELKMEILSLREMTDENNIQDVQETQIKGKTSIESSEAPKIFANIEGQDESETKRNKEPQRIQLANVNEIMNNEEYIPTLPELNRIEDSSKIEMTRNDIKEEKFETSEYSKIQDLYENKRSASANATEINSPENEQIESLEINDVLKIEAHSLKNQIEAHDETNDTMEQKIELTTQFQDLINQKINDKNLSEAKIKQENEQIQLVESEEFLIIDETILKNQTEADDKYLDKREQETQVMKQLQDSIVSVNEKNQREAKIKQENEQIELVENILQKQTASNSKILKTAEQKTEAEKHLEDLIVNDDNKIEAERKQEIQQIESVETRDSLNTKEPILNKQTGADRKQIAPMEQKTERTKQLHDVIVSVNEKNESEAKLKQDNEQVKLVENKNIFNTDLPIFEKQTGSNDKIIKMVEQTTEAKTQLQDLIISISDANQIETERKQEKQQTESVETRANLNTNEPTSKKQTGADDNKVDAMEQKTKPMKKLQDFLVSVNDQNKNEAEIKQDNEQVKLVENKNILNTDQTIVEKQIGSNDKIIKTAEQTTEAKTQIQDLIISISDVNQIEAERKGENQQTESVETRDNLNTNESMLKKRIKPLEQKIEATKQLQDLIVSVNDKNESEVNIKQIKEEIESVKISEIHNADEPLSKKQTESDDENVDTIEQKTIAMKQLQDVIVSINNQNEKETKIKEEHEAMESSKIPNTNDHILKKETVADDKIFNTMQDKRETLKEIQNLIEVTNHNLESEGKINQENKQIQSVKTNDILIADEHIFKMRTGTDDKRVDTIEEEKNTLKKNHDFIQFVNDKMESDGKINQRNDQTDLAESHDAMKENTETIREFLETNNAKLDIEGDGAVNKLQIQKENNNTEENAVETIFESKIIDYEHVFNAQSASEIIHINEADMIGKQINLKVCYDEKSNIDECEKINLVCENILECDKKHEQQNEHGLRENNNELKQINETEIQNFNDNILNDSNCGDRYKNINKLDVESVSKIKDISITTEIEDSCKNLLSMQSCSDAGIENALTTYDNKKESTVPKNGKEDFKIDTNIEEKRDDSHKNKYLKKHISNDSIQVLGVIDIDAEICKENTYKTEGVKDVLFVVEDNSFVSVETVDEVVEDSKDKIVIIKDNSNSNKKAEIDKELGVDLSTQIEETVILGENTQLTKRINKKEVEVDLNLIEQNKCTENDEMKQMVHSEKVNENVHEAQPREEILENIESKDNVKIQKLMSSNKTGNEKVKKKKMKDKTKMQLELENQEVIISQQSEIDDDANKGGASDISTAQNIISQRIGNANITQDLIEVEKKTENNKFIENQGSTVALNVSENKRDILNTKECTNAETDLLQRKASNSSSNIDIRSGSTSIVPESEINNDHLKERPVFVNRNDSLYEMEFLRPSHYNAKSFDIGDPQMELELPGKSPAIFKAQTLLYESQLRSSMPPNFNQRLNNRDVCKDLKQRSKATSETRSTISEKRTGFPRDHKRKPVFSTHLTDRTAVDSSRVKLTCSILSPSDPTVSWYKNGVLLDNKHKYRTKQADGLITLEILNAVPGDSGEYSCTIENENGSITSTANLKVYQSFEASPIPPTFTRSIRDTYHLREDELVLECRIRGQPLPTITWLKDSIPIVLTERYQAHYLADGVSRLTIASPNEDDAGKYTCKAENSMWSDQISHNVQFIGKTIRNIKSLKESNIAKLTHLNIESRRPHFTNVLSDHKVVRGGTIGLQVEIGGSPTRVEWLREGHSVIDTYRNAQTYVDRGLYTLALPDVTEKESGLYTCRAWSTHGTVDMNASITVVQPSELEGKPATIISRPAKDLLISVGEDVNISFRVQGEPKPKVFFMKGIRDITNSQRVCKMTSDDYVKYTLKRSVVSDAGTYCVLARNAYGCDRAFVTVIIRQRASSDNLISDWTYPMDDLAISFIDRNYQSVPDRIPSEPSTIDRGNNWVSLAWPKPETQVKAPILAYKVECWLLGKEGGARWTELGITPRNSFDAFNLQQGEEYHFRVTPRNRYGWGESVQTSTPIGIGLAGDRPEFINILPGQLKFLVGEIALLSCSFKGKPMPDIVWMKNGHEIEDETERFTIALNGNITSLQINDIKIEDEGRYSCEATNIHGRSSTYSRVAIITDKQIWEADVKLKRERSAGTNAEYPPQFTMRLRDRRVQATYPVRLTCQVVGNPSPIVTWFKNGEEVLTDDRHTISQDEYFYTLEIAPTTLEDGGVYETMARNGCGAISCRCNLVVDKGIRAYIAPEFCCGFDPLYRVREGDELRISAIVEAYPSVGVTWYRDGVRLRPSRRAVMTLDRDGQIELALASVAIRDAGVYTCTASNEVGMASTSGKVEVITDDHTDEMTKVPPIVISPDVPYSKEPMFITKPRSSEAHEGDTVIIECEVIGDPKPDVYWLRDFLKPDYYRDASHFKRIGAGPEYRFEIPHAKFDYTGAYSIVAKNIHGEAKAIISLQILAKDPTTSDDTHNIRYGRVHTIPRFEKNLTDLLCYDGDAIEFECRVTGNPEPDIRWFHYAEVIPECEDFETFYDLGTARLKIKQVAAEDEGTYTCEASNNMGKATSSACLVIYPPGEPNTLSQRLRRPPALLSASSTPRSTPRTTPARSLSRTPGPELRRVCSPALEIAPKFYTYPYNKVAEEGDTVVFQCAVRGLPPPWATWDKDGMIITPSARISIKEKDDMLRILEIEQVSVEDVGLYRVTLENDYGRAEASARLEVISQTGKFYGSRSFSVSPRKCLPYRRRTPSLTRQD